MADCFKKTIIVIVNLIFLALGIAVLAMGIIFKVAWNDMKDAFAKDDENDIDLKGNGEMLGIVSIVLGCFIVVLSLCGCCGAWCSNKVLMAVYGFVVALLLIAEIGCVIALSVNAFHVGDKLEESLKHSLKNFNEDLSDDKSASWATVFKKLECCGVTNPTKDFKDVNFTKSTSRLDTEDAEYPVACCTKFDQKNDKVDKNLFQKDDIKKCMTKSSSEGQFYNLGCEQKVRDWLSDHKPIVIGVGCGVFIVQLFLVIMTCYLVRKDSD